jgi:hypothetical protein
MDNLREKISYKEYLLKFEKVADLDIFGNRIYRPITEEEAERFAKYKKLLDSISGEIFEIYITEPHIIP